MNFLRRSLILVTLMSFVLGSTVSAQNGAPDQEGPKLWVVQNIQVEPTMEVQFEETLREKAEAFKQARLGVNYMWSVSRGYLSVGDYWVIRPLKSFADLDHLQGEWVLRAQRAIGKTKLDDLETREAAAIRTIQNTISVHVAELSYRPEEPGMTNPVPGFLHMGVDYVRPGMTEQYYRVIRDFRNALAKINHPFGYQVYRVVFGGKQAYIFVWSNDSAEQYYRVNQLPRLVTQALGPEGAAKMGREWRECLWKFEMFDTRPRPELSFLPVSAVFD